MWFFLVFWIKNYGKLCGRLCVERKRLQTGRKWFRLDHYFDLFSNILRMYSWKKVPHPRIFYGKGVLHYSYYQPCQNRKEHPNLAQKQRKNTQLSRNGKEHPTFSKHRGTPNFLETPRNTQLSRNGRKHPTFAKHQRTQLSQKQKENNQLSAKRKGTPNFFPKDSRSLLVPNKSFVPISVCGNTNSSKRRKCKKKNKTNLEQKHCLCAILPTTYCSRTRSTATSFRIYPK